MSTLNFTLRQGHLMDRRHLLERECFLDLLLYSSSRTMSQLVVLPLHLDRMLLQVSLQRFAKTVSGYYGVSKETILGTNSRLSNFHPLLLSQGR